MQYPDHTISCPFAERIGDLDRSVAVFGERIPPEFGKEWAVVKDTVERLEKTVGGNGLSKRVTNIETRLPWIIGGIAVISFALGGGTERLIANFFSRLIGG